jgi:tetratricopeptide (TPR) repeat protein
VRKQGQRVRITAQLIEAGNDAHLWSQTYERELVDIFQVQEEIAMAITTALEDILGTRQVSVKAPTRDLEAYQDFLRGRSSFYQRIDLDRAIDDLESAVERDPEFAEAWAFLAAATGILSIGGWPTDRDPAALADREVSASERALELDPNIPIVLAGIGRRLTDKGEVTRGLTMMERAARRTDPDTSPRLWLGIKLAELGHVDRALPWFESAHVQDPLVSINHGYLGYAYAVIGREEESVRIASRGLELNPLGFWMQVLALEAFHKGDMARFDELSLKISDAGPQGAEDAQLLESARAAVADPAKRDALFAPWPRESAEDTVVFLSLLVSDTERLFHAVGRTHLAGQRYMRLAAWLPSLGWLREDPRFYEFMRQSGAVEYWEAEGFPPGCRPVDDPAGGRLDCSEYSL